MAWLPSPVCLATLFLVALCTIHGSFAVAADDVKTDAKIVDQIAPAKFQTTPVADSKQLPKSKFTSRPALNVEDVKFPVDASGLQKKSECPIDIQLVWTNKLDTGVYTTPIIEPILHDGSKQIIVGGFRRDLEILDSDGHRLPEWPFQVDDVYFHTSPVLVDTRKLGFLDFVWVGVNGEIFVVSGDPTSSGLLIQEPYFIPKLRVKKFWYRGLQLDRDLKMNPGVDTVPLNDKQAAEMANFATANSTGGRSLLSLQDDPDDRDPFITPQWAEGDVIPATPLQATEDSVDDKTVPDAAWMDQLGDGLSDEAKASFDLLTDQDDYEDYGKADHLEDGHLATDHGSARQHAEPREREWVYVDPHVMASPVAVDITGDGIPELIVSVSYFFDEDEYNNNAALMSKLDPDVNIKKYVAGGVVAYDIHKQEMVWTQQLDLTTDETDLRAFVYASPTVIDLDGDGDLEVVVGTSLGFIYVLNARTGKTLPGFPISMSEIQAQITVADVNSDGKLEMIAVDNKGNVLCFNKEGKEIWESRISGFVAQGATFGDVDGNGVLDVVLGTVTGTIWALRGDNGKQLDAFPVRTNGKVLAPILLVNLDKTLESKGLHLVVPSFDGHMYVIDGRTGCTNKVDFGEKAYAMVLTDDILGHEKMDLLLTTMSGNVYCFSTGSPYHPLKSWSSQNQRLNGFSARYDHHGIFVTDETRHMGDVLGSTVNVGFEIVDNRPGKAQSNKRYTVTVSLEGSVWLNKTYTTPGVKVEQILAPQYPTHGTFLIEMYNEHHQYFHDSVSLGFNVHYYRTLKYLVVVPFLGLAGVLMFVKTLKPTLPI